MNVRPLEGNSSHDSIGVIETFVLYHNGITSRHLPSYVPYRTYINQYHPTWGQMQLSSYNGVYVAYLWLNKTYLL